MVCVAKILKKIEISSLYQKYVKKLPVLPVNKWDKGHEITPPLSHCCGYGTDSCGGSISYPS